MMTKKRTSIFASIKLLAVIPVTGLVFLAVSSYSYPPDLPDSQRVIIDSAQPSPYTRSETVLPPPPPPLPSSNVRNEKPEAFTEEPYVVVEEMPMFPGGDAELLKYIGENTKYPPSAKEQNIQGRVIIRFCITAVGSVSQISVIKGVDQALDEEAMRVVRTLPDFEPGRQGGRPVPVWYMVPITFSLK